MSAQTICIILDHYLRDKETGDPLALSTALARLKEYTPISGLYLDLYEDILYRIDALGKEEL